MNGTPLNDARKFTGNNLYNCFDRPPCPPMTLEELRGRLKHIATLCIGLSIDLSNEIELRQRLEKETEKLREELKIEKAKPKRKQRTPEQVERHRKVMLDYYAKKREQQQQTPKSED